MSGTNETVVRANSDAFSRRDVDGMLEHYAPDAVVTDRRSVGWGEFRGHDALRSYYQGLFDNADELDEDLTIVSAGDDQVVAACHLTARLAGHPEGPPLEFDYALRITITGGLIRSMDIYADAEAAGRDEQA